MNEIWKDIEGFEGLYQVSNIGRVKSLDRFDSRGRKIRGKILKLRLREDGYMEVKLYKNGKYKWFKIHRIVAETFLGNPNNLPFINHKNEIKNDNRVENLEFCDHSYNMNYGTVNQRRSATQTNGLQSKPVYQYTLDGEFVAKYPSVSEAQRQLGLKHISCCCLGKRNRSGNYKWRYKK